jgi:hypothetical protein
MYVVLCARACKRYAIRFILHTGASKSAADGDYLHGHGGSIVGGLVVREFVYNNISLQIVV